MISRVAAWIRAAEYAAVLTGAEISAESGVPVFRGPGGRWRQFRPEELAAPVELHGNLWRAGCADRCAGDILPAVERAL